MSDETRVIEGEVVDQEIVKGEIKSMLPVPIQEGTSIVLPAVAIEEAVQAYQAYQQLDQRILSDEDYMFYVQYKQGNYAKETAFTNPEEAGEFAAKVGGKVARRKRKSAFRKLGNFFGLTMPDQDTFLGSEITTLEDGYVLREWGKGWQGFCFMNRGFEVLRQQYTGAVIHKNSGTVYVGVGACSADERKAGRAGYKQRDHTIMATAWSRMVSRVISDVIGLGEVSVEEIQDLDEIEAEEQAKKAPTQPSRRAAPKPTQEDDTETTPGAERDFPHWGSVFKTAWEKLKVNRSQVMDLFPGKSQDDLLEEYGSLTEVFNAISDRVAISRAGGEVTEPLGGDHPAVPEKPGPGTSRPEESSGDHKFSSLNEAFDALMGEANLALALEGIEGYDHANQVRGALKQGGWTGYKPTAWQAMVDFLVKRKASPTEEESRWQDGPEIAKWLHETLGLSDKDVEKAVGVPLAEYQGKEAGFKALVLRYLTQQLASEKAA
jgi:hypothetical protein